MALKSTERRVDELELDKQDNLVSGVNIKTINGNSVLGSGNLTIGGGGSATWGGITGTLSSQTDLQSALNAKENTITAGTTSQYYRGDKTFQTLDKTAVNLGNVDNTSDLNKPISTLTQTALNAKQNALTLTTTGTSGAATLVGATLNIPQYGGGGGGIHLQRTVPSGSYGNLFIVYSGFTASTVSANRLYLYPFIPNKNITIQSLTISVSTLFAGGLAKILIYSDVSGVPTTKLYESADLNCSTTGIKTATTSQTFIAGTTYWIGFIANNSTNVFSFYGQGAVLGFGTSNFSTATHAFLNTTFASIPNTLTSVLYSSGNIPAVTLQNV